MKFLFVLTLCATVIGLIVGCGTTQGGAASKRKLSAPASPVDQDADSTAVATPNSFPVIHVFVVLCDNVNQGIVPVSASLGNGDNPATNLYWGAAFGVKTFFSKNKDWELVSETQNPSAAILDRLIFKKKNADVEAAARPQVQRMEHRVRATMGHAVLRERVGRKRVGSERVGQKRAPSAS